MPGKLPIDPVRAAEDAPRIYMEEKQRFAMKQAKLRDGSRPTHQEATAPADAALGGHAPEDLDDG